MKQGGQWTLIESAEVTRARSALAEETRFVSALLDSTAASVVAIDAAGRITRCNATLERLLGKPREELIGSLVWDTLQLNPDQPMSVSPEPGGPGEIFCFESTLRRPDGDLVLSWCTASVLGRDGERVGRVMTGQDITAHRKSEHRLRQAYELEHRIATTLQESLLPAIPDVEGMRLGVAYKPANEAERVGGDFYDIYQLSDGRVVVAVGDVSGKGVGAAGLTETIRSVLRTLLHMGLPLAEALTRANDVILARTSPEDFVTVGVAIIDAELREFRYASAGHPPPIMRTNSSTRFLEIPQGVPLGACAGEYSHVTFRLDPAECLLMYTDGLGDARRGAAFFWDDLLEEVDRQPGDPDGMVEGLLASAERFSAKSLADDIAIVALQLL